MCICRPPIQAHAPTHTHTHVWMGVGLYKEPGVTTHFALFLIGNYRSSVTTISPKIE